jgi:hypothetical protein
MNWNLNAADRSTDFDFFFGRWHVRNRRLKTRLQNADDWEEFDGIQICQPLLGGLANYDELQTPQGEPLGMTIHLFNLETRQWSANWVPSRDGILQSPVIGSFSNGTGIFEGREEFQGKPCWCVFSGRARTR